MCGTTAEPENTPSLTRGIGNLAFGDVSNDADGVAGGEHGRRDAFA